MINELSKQICEKCGIKDNVDFSEPTNFVKLLELPINPKGTLLWWKINQLHKNPPYERSKFLIYLLIILKEKYKYHFKDEKEKEELKQSIREAEWKYE